MWKIAEVIFDLVLLPFLLIALVWLFIGGIWSLVHLIRRVRSDGRSACLPLLTVLLGILVGFVVIPVPWISEEENFWRYRGEREAVVRLVRAEKLEKLPGSSRLRKLPWLHRHVSDGRDVWVDQPDGNTGVFFYTFRGLLTGGSRGILYTLADTPEQLGTFRELEKLDDHWYRFVTED